LVGASSRFRFRRPIGAIHRPGRPWRRGARLPESVIRRFRLKIAPGLTLEFRPSGTLEIPNLLDRGELDLAIGPYGRQGEVLRPTSPAAGV